MAGYIDAEALDTYATIGAKLILTDDFLKQLNASFENDPDGCFRILTIEFLNIGYLNALVEKHPDFRTIAERFRQAQDNSVHPTDYYTELFNSSVKLSVTDPYEYDVDFNIILAVILNTFFSEAVRIEYGGAFLNLFERCQCEVYGAACMLFPCALWGANYENFREITTSKYYGLKAQGFDKEDDAAELNSNQGFDEAAQDNALIQQAKKNVPNYSEKVEFLREYTGVLASGNSFAQLSNDLPRGKKYAQIYMELAKYYMPTTYRFQFIKLCLTTLPELVTSPNGIISADFFIDQFEKLIEEDRDTASQIAKLAASHVECDLAFVEQTENMAAGRFDAPLNWGKIADYFMPKAIELGWDGYYEDGPSRWAPSNSSISSNGNSAAAARNTTNNSFSSSTSTPTPKTSGCYIATAVYGSYNCPEVWTLRRFRDSSLARSWYGRAFIKVYYAVSPTLVKWFGQTAWFNKLWRGPLDRLVARLKSEGYDDGPYND